MDAAHYWKLFTMTGAPEVYLLYRRAVKLRDRVAV